jgi:hypothetical protein
VNVDVRSNQSTLSVSTDNAGQKLKILPPAAFTRKPKLTSVRPEQKQITQSNESRK